VELGAGEQVFEITVKFARPRVFSPFWGIAFSRSGYLMNDGLAFYLLPHIFVVFHWCTRVEYTPPECSRSNFDLAG